MGNSGLKQHYETASKTGVLQLSNNKLKDIPTEVFTLSDCLRNLDLSKNKITNIPGDISKLKNLKQLNISCNTIHNIPDSLTNLRKLELLNLSNNSISEIPNSFSNLNNLKQLHLSNNKFNHFPPQIFELRNLEVLDLSNNKLVTLPEGMSKLSAAEVNLSRNEISALSEDLHEAPRLKILRLEENCLCLEAIKPNLLKDSKIHTINIDGNLFEPKQLATLEGYSEYTERYTAMKKKMF